MPITDKAIAHDLATALAELERTRVALEDAPPETILDAANAYQASRAAALPVFAAAQVAYEGTPPDVPPPPAPVSEPGPTEASDGVPLVAPPGIVVGADAPLENWGPLVSYRVIADPQAEPIQATPYAFAEGTAIATAEGTVATAQASRVIRGEDGLAIIANDVFNQTYEAIEPVAGGSVAPPLGEQPAGEAGPDAAVATEEANAAKVAAQPTPPEEAPAAEEPAS